MLYSANDDDVSTDETRENMNIYCQLMGLGVGLGLIMKQTNFLKKKVALNTAF